MNRVLLVLSLLLVPVPTGARELGPCVDGIDCYCDCVEDTLGTGPNTMGGADDFASVYCKTQGIPIDPNLIWCEDFEDPTYEDPDQDINNWRDLYGQGGTPCTNDRNNGVIEGENHACRNILQRPGCPLYSAGDPDRNESGGHPTLDGTWDGCQSWYFPIKVGLDGGGGAAHFKPANYQGVTTLSHTMMVKYSSNHFIGAQNQLFSGNVKGDRYSVGSANALFNTVNGGQHSIKDINDSCTRGSSDPATGYPVGDKFPFSSLWKTRNSSGILGQGICCNDNCYADDPGPSGARIGAEDHKICNGPEGCIERRLVPPRSLWNPRVDGGIPPYTTDFAGDSDGRDEWLCFQWTMEDHGTDSANFYHWINSTIIMRFENLKMSADLSPMKEDIAWLNQSTSPDPNAFNNTSDDWVQVRDNYHLTASATPATCFAVGFGAPIAPTVPVPTETEGVSFADGVSFN